MADHTITPECAEKQAVFLERLREMKMLSADEAPRDGACLVLFFPDRAQVKLQEHQAPVLVW